MKAQATASDLVTPVSHLKTASVSVHRSARYQKVIDGRKQPIRGLWQRNGRFVARLGIENHGRKQMRWVPLGDAQNPIATVPQALKVLHKLQEHRDTDALPVLGRTPKFDDFVPEYFLEVERLNKLADRPGSSNKEKRQSTIEKERGTLELWKSHLGDTRLNKINSDQMDSFVRKRQDAAISNRTITLDIIALRNVLKLAIKRKYIKDLPKINMDELNWTSPKRALVTAADIEKVCASGFKPLYCEGQVANGDEPGQPLKNARQFADYIRLMAYCGARRNEALRIEWKDVKWDQQQIEIGSDGLAKSHKARFVDFNPLLQAHLKDMLIRRAPDSRWLFPSPQRGDRDEHAKTFRESLSLAREAAGMPHFGFHDCRHHFISFCVMSGIDFMTIAAWVGHEDGGILIGKVYGHLANEHRRLMAARFCNQPTFVQSESEATAG